MQYLMFGVFALLAIIAISVDKIRRIVENTEFNFSISVDTKKLAESIIENMEQQTEKSGCSVYACPMYRDGKCLDNEYDNCIKRKK